ncbi:hypothetical protein Poli38472_003061 [Pythium oligandrum]|uniref:Fibronectin type-III domain-containing protein n=1 Tax=Pythium oligandrum TaxID=41045 RepID=A0A8K1FCF5_PYTOL|nr:hypothetical protein Poli38472_003061 [Pythium oligandrum]|eukprot:TMW57136.1 hypothetical protein Poli38472_003061 [Pythium oligandrum]
MTLSPPPPAHLKDRTEFSITLHVPTEPVGVTFRYEYRPVGSEWTEAKRIDTKSGDSEVVLDDLMPTSSYEIRIYAVKKEGETEEVSAPSEVAAVDTEVPGCTPEPKCVIL